MSERNWGFIFAAGLMAGGALALLFLVWTIGLNYCPGDPCEYTRNPGHNPSKYEYNIPFSSGPNTSPWEEPEDTKGNPYYYSQKDLRAQESVARATNALVWLALISGIFSFLGAALLVWTLVETRKNNQIAREIGEAQVRAYLSFETVQAVYVNGNDGPVSTIVLRPFIKNTGTSPARLRYLASDVRFSAPDIQTFAIPKENRKGSSMRIGGGANFFAEGGTITWADAVASNEDGRVLVVAAIVEFVDVFNEEKIIREHFCYMLAFNARFLDPALPYQLQPSCEWRDFPQKVDVVIDGE